MINKIALKKDTEELETRLEQLQQVRQGHICELYNENNGQDDLIQYHADSIRRLTDQIVSMKRDIKHNITFCGE